MLVALRYLRFVTGTAVGARKENKMVFSEAQKRRFAEEEKILEQYFPNSVKWFNRETNNMKVEIKMTTNSNKSYTLRVCIPDDFPNSCPELYVCDPPRPLKTKEGTEIDAGTQFHSYGTKDGLTTICHFVSSQWTNEYTLYQVFMKGRIWLEAYEIHLRTGKPMADFLREMESPESVLAVALLQGILAAHREEEERSSSYPQAEAIRSQNNRFCLIQ